MDKPGSSGYFVYGINPVRERLKIISQGVLFIKKNVQQARLSEIVEKARSKNIAVNYLDAESFEKFFMNFNHQGVVLKVDRDFTEHISDKEFAEYLEGFASKKSSLLILDGIQDVGNLGAVLRSALLFDADGVIMPKDNSAPLTNVVEKRSSGAAALLKIMYVTNIVRIMEIMKDSGYWIYGADKEGQSIKSVDFNDKSVIVIGQENTGIRPLVKKNCDLLVSIPTNNKIDSLNLSVSAGIFLYQRYIKNL